MKIVLQDTNGTYTIETRDEFITIEEVIGRLVVPVLQAASFSDNLIKQYIVLEE